MPGSIILDAEVLDNLDYFPKRRPDQAVDEFVRINLKTMTVFSEIANSEHPSLNVSVVAFDAFEAHIATLDKPGRYQILMHNKAHYAVIDVQINENGKKSAIILDAAGDPRSRVLERMFLAADYDQYFLPVADPAGTVRAPQRDSFNCGSFSLDHAIQMAAIDDIHQHFDTLEAPMERELAWIDLPPQLIRNIQSMKELQAYKDQHVIPEGTTKEAYFEALDEYVAKGTTIDEGGKPRNESITRNVRDVFVSKAKLLHEEKLEHEDQGTFKERYQAQKEAGAAQPLDDDAAASAEDAPPPPKLN